MLNGMAAETTECRRVAIALSEMAADWLAPLIEKTTVFEDEAKTTKTEQCKWLEIKARRGLSGFVGSLNLNKNRERPDECFFANAV
jgi:hypothetical protein